MGRPRKNQSTRPPCYFEHRGKWYLVKKRKWTPLPEVRSLADAHRHYAASIEKPVGEHQLDAIFDAVFARLKNRPVDKWSPNTVRQYTLGLAKLKHLLRKFPAPEQVKQKDAAQVKVLLGPTPNMANRVISLARQIFNDLVEHQVIDSNPFLGVKRHKEAKRTRLIQWEEWHKIRAVAPRRLQLVMDGLYLTDRRVSEQLLNLDERDALPEGIYFPSTKTDKELIVRWNPDLRAWWDECLAQHRRGNVVVLPSTLQDRGDRPRPVFRTRHGRRPAYKTVYDQWTLACERAKVKDCNLHDNRAFSATEMKKQAGGGEAGESAAQRLLGHRERSTTFVYLRDREIEVVDGPMFKKASA